MHVRTHRTHTHLAEDSSPDPLETPFSDTRDYSERQARYRMTARLSLDRVRAIIDQRDGLDDLMTRVHLLKLRDTLGRLDLVSARHHPDARPRRRQKP